MINESIKNISTSAFFKGENVGCSFESDNLTSIYKGFYTQTHISPKIAYHQIQLHQQLLFQSSLIQEAAELQYQIGEISVSFACNI